MPPDQSSWSLRLLIGSPVLIPGILQVTGATWTITPVWDGSLAKTINGTDVTYPNIPNPPKDQPYNQQVNVALSFQYTANGQINGETFNGNAQGIVSNPNPAKIGWTGENLRAGWYVSYGVEYDDNNDPYLLVEAIYAGAETA